jgi:hypothetical protein
MSTATVTHMGVSMVVQFDYEPAERSSFDCPGYPEQCDVTTVSVGGVEITPLLDIDVIHSIETLILEGRDDSIRQAAEDRAEERDFERRTGAYA